MARRLHRKSIKSHYSQTARTAIKPMRAVVVSRRMNRNESPESWRHIFAEMREEELPSWTLLWHLYAQSDNSLTAAQIAHRMHIPEEGVVRLMNSMGVNIAEQTGWFPVPRKGDGWKVFFTRKQSPTGEFVYSIKEYFLPILANFRK